MRIDYPREHQLPQLRALWKAAFRDEDAFLELYFNQIFSPDRCRCLCVEDTVAAALYWFDCRCDGRPMAYVYAVATDPAHRNQGLCAALMADTHALLKSLGYAGSILVPGEPELFQMYDKMGYRICASIGEARCKAATEPVALRPINREEYADLRRTMLPEGGVLQEGESLIFLEHLTQFYTGDGFLLCASLEKGKLTVPELLGEASLAPGIVAALGAKEGDFRFPGDDRSFAMYCPFTDAPAPKYFGLAFD